MGALISALSMASSAFATSFCLLFQGVSCACSTASCFACLFNSATGKQTGVSPRAANLFNVVLFGLSMILAVVLRFDSGINHHGLDFGAFRHACRSSADSSYFDLLPDYFNSFSGATSLVGQQECNRGVEAVHRISFAMCLFFSVLLLGTLAVPRLHRGFWMIKLVLFFGLLVMSFFLDGFNAEAYSQVARFAGMVFLVLQIFLLIDFVYEVNERLVDQEQVNAILLTSFVLFETGLVGIVCLFVFYTKCVEGIVFTTLTLVFAIAVVLVSVFRYRFIEDCEGTLLPACAVVFYMVYLAWSSLESNHAQCREEAQSGGAQTTLSVVLGSLFSTASLMWATYSVSNGLYRPDAPLVTSPRRDLESGSGRPMFAHHLMRHEDGDGDAADGRKAYYGEADGEDDEDQDEVTEPLWSFYLIMVLASMYMSMLLTDWGTVKTLEAAATGNGDHSAVASMYVKIAAQWVTVIMFVWTLVAPAILKNREF